MRPGLVSADSPGLPRGRGSRQIVEGGAVRQIVEGGAVTRVLSFRSFFSTGRTGTARGRKLLKKKLT